MAIIGDCDYWSYPSGRFVRLYTDGCVVDSRTGLMGPCKRRPAKKVPSLHLTGEKSMKYIAEANAKTKAKEAKVAKEDKIKKEAVKKSQAA